MPLEDATLSSAIPPETVAGAVEAGWTWLSCVCAVHYQVDIPLRLFPPARRLEAILPRLVCRHATCRRPPVSVALARLDPAPGTRHGATITLPLVAACAI